MFKCSCGQSVADARIHLALTGASRTFCRPKPCPASAAGRAALLAHDVAFDHVGRDAEACPSQH